MENKKLFVIIGILSLILFAGFVQNEARQLNPDIVAGDLLFQDLDCGELCDAIEAVTPAVKGKKLSHIGMVVSKDDSLFVLEAIGKDVHLTRLKEFIRRNRDASGKPKIIVGRMKKEFRQLNKEAAAFAMKQLGTPYDETFQYDNGRYYCSELIYDAYKIANGGKEVFTLAPMTFKDPATSQTFPAWAAYYDAMHMFTPEGQPGCNPAGIANGGKVDIVSVLY
jgi:hypothetical protein